MERSKYLHSLERMGGGYYIYGQAVQHLDDLRLWAKGDKVKYKIDFGRGDTKWAILATSERVGLEYFTVCTYKSRDAKRKFLFCCLEQLALILAAILLFSVGVVTTLYSNNLEFQSLGLSSAFLALGMLIVPILYLGRWYRNYKRFGELTYPVKQKEFFVALDGYNKSKEYLNKLVDKALDDIINSDEIKEKEFNRLAQVEFNKLQEERLRIESLPKRVKILTDEDLNVYLKT